MQMELDVFDRYFEAIDILSAREKLVELNVSAYPHSTKNGRSKIHKELHKLAYPKLSESKQITTEDLAKILGGQRG